MSKYGYFLLSFALILFSPVLTPPGHTAPQAQNPMSQTIKQKSKSNPTQNTPPQQPQTVVENTAKIGYLLMDLDTGQTLESSQDQETFIPASVSKVPTTLAALHILGSNHRFITSVQSTAQVINGTLQGDLILVGGGDPSLSMAGLMDLALQLRLKGIQRIQGRFLYDESALLPDMNISNEQNEEETYNQGVSALTLDFNRVRLSWSIHSSGRISTQIVPNLGYVSLLAGETSRFGPNLTFLNGERGEVWRLNPHGARSGWEWVPIKQPARYTALVFREFSHQAAIDLPAPEPGRTTPTAKTLASHASPPLSDLVDATLEHSNNLWTELISMNAASRLSGQPQSVISSAKLLSTWMTRQIPGTDWTGFHLANSCGLTAVSRISPRQMVAILQWANGSLAGERAFASLLPISGWKGTLTSRFSTPESSLRVWAKTGTILYGKALAGYLFTHQNRRLAFAIFASDFVMRKAFDARMGQHSPNEIAQGRLWNSKASGQISALVEKWLHNY
ncbi:MAG: D-alanyl-D-alanine carboxypeptidase/D-alanyl-D-alanine-endopeptidase [Magnetococcus sp. YQC-5]